MPLFFSNCFSKSLVVAHARRVQKTKGEGRARARGLASLDETARSAAALGTKRPPRHAISYHAQHTRVSPAPTMPRLVALLALGSSLVARQPAPRRQVVAQSAPTTPKYAPARGTAHARRPAGGCGDAIGSTMSCSMFLYSAGLSGTIPTEIGLYKNMMRNGYLELFGNRLSGTIPTELSHWRM